MLPSETDVPLATAHKNEFAEVISEVERSGLDHLTQPKSLARKKCGSEMGSPYTASRVNSIAHISTSSKTAIYF